MLCEQALRLGLPCHKTGTVVTIEGPRFSTRAESRMFRLWGGDVINMTTATEAALANELGLPYAVIAMSTDYDAWNEEEEQVSWEQVLKVFNDNAGRVAEIIMAAVPRAANLFYDAVSGRRPLVMRRKGPHRGTRSSACPDGRQKRSPAQGA